MDEIKIAFPSQFVGPATHKGLIWVSNTNCDDKWANDAIVEGRLQAGPARATLTHSSASLEAQGIVGMYGEPILKKQSAAAPTPTLPPALAPEASPEPFTTSPEPVGIEPTPTAQPEGTATKKPRKPKVSNDPKPAKPKAEKPAAPAKPERPTQAVQESLF